MGLASPGWGWGRTLGFPGALAEDPCGQLTPSSSGQLPFVEPLCAWPFVVIIPLKSAAILGDGTSVIPILQMCKLRLREVTQVTRLTRGGARLLARSFPTARGHSRSVSQKNSVTPGP